MNEYLHGQAIRSDLEWILNSPPLIEPGPQLWQPQWLEIDQDRLRQDVSTLNALERPRKLGDYFELLAGYLFEISPRYDIIAKNLVIHGATQTLGELDLLIRERHTKRVIHIELALKFYLWVPGAQQAASAWIGAGLHDFLYRKVDRLSSHQMRLPQLARQQNCWPSSLPFPDAHYLWMPGRLYLPASENLTGIPDTQFSNGWRLNPLAHRSCWLASEDTDHTALAPLNKVDWLTAQPLVSPKNRLPAQFKHPDYHQPVYVLPEQWHTNALTAIQRLMNEP